MPRMSIDDEFRNDPRVLRLAKACGWNRRETMGCLFDIWARNYERASEFLPEPDIDAIAELDGFTRHLVACDLGRETKRGIRIAGAKDRIAYLKQKREAGSRGGIKSGESRRKSAKRPLRPASSKSNPLVPDLVPDPATADPEREEPPPAPARPVLSLVKSAVWIPNWTGTLATARDLAQARGVDIDAQVIAFTAWADSKRWPPSERDARLAAWLTRERNTDPARAKPKPRKPEPPPPNCAPLSDEERVEFEQLAARIADNPDAAAQALRHEAG